ncbi:MAG: hypothetical protein K2P80_12995 [Beijerinckiaceae bacterium]|nr:hypothetical protein [Beijerinckiaceae bacterium]
MAGHSSRPNGSDIDVGAPDAEQASESRRQPSLESAKLGGDAIGRALQAHFRDLAAEPIPDRFLDLLASLESKEKS